MIAAMQRCLYIYDSGFQCVDETLESTDFCAAHQKVVYESFDGLEESGLRKVFLRFVALILLFMFLLPLYYTLRDLYFGPPVKAQEGF
jgi:hypothetical protein